MADEPLSVDELERLRVTADRWFNNDEQLLMARLIAEVVRLRLAAQVYRRNAER